MRVRSLLAGPAALALVIVALAGASPAAAATVTASLDCDSASQTITASDVAVSGDTLSLTVVRCNQYDITLGTNVSGPTSINGASSQVLTFSISGVPSSTLVTVFRTSASKSFPIANGSNAWTARSPVNGVIGSTYNTSGYQFTATGATAGSYTLVGTAPPGLSLSTAGLLSGTPTTIGSYTFSVNATVSSSTVNSGNVTVTITGPVVTKVTICHRTRATTNPYRLITVSVNSIISSSGHSQHDTTRTNKDNPQTPGTVETTGSGVFNPSFNYPSNQKWWGDIIPPFTHSAGTYAGLNWNSISPDPSGGTAGWLEDAEFASAAASSGDAAWKAAVETCVALTGTVGAKSPQALAVDDPDKFFKVMVENGEDPDETRDDLVEQQADSGSGPETVPSTTALQTTYETLNATVRTDNPSGVTQTQAVLNGTLRATSGSTTWASWYFSYSTSRTGTFTDTATTNTSGSGNQAQASTVTGLTCGTTYFYRIVGTTASPTATYQGLLKSFTTEACGNGNSNNNGGGGGGSSSGGGGGGGSSSSSTPATTPTTPSTPPGQERRTPPRRTPVTPPTPGTSVIVDDNNRERRVRPEVPPTRNEASIDDGQGPISFRSRTPDGTIPPPPPGGVIEVPRDRPLEITGGGFEPGTEVEVVLLNPERSLGKIPVDPSGNISGEVPLPSDLAPGTVTIQINGFGSGLTARSITLPISVSEQQRKPQEARVQAPKSITMGRTAVITLPARTTSGQQVTAKVSCTPVLRVMGAADRQGCVVKRDGRQLRITVASMNPIAVSVAMSAPGTKTQYPYERTLRYVVR